MTLQAGSLKQIERFGANPEPELIQILNQHRAIALDQAARLERNETTLNDVLLKQERMIASFEDKLRAAQQSYSLEWQPGGDDAMAVRCYGLEDGSLQLLTTERQIKVPFSNTPVKARKVGYLTDPYPVTRAQADVQRLYLAFGVASRIASARKSVRSIWDNELVRTAWVKLASALERMPGEAGKRLRIHLDRAMSGGTGLGYEWIERPQLDTLIRPYDIESAFVGRIGTQAAPAKLFNRPTISGEVVFYKAGNVTNNNPSAYTVSDVTTGETSTTIKDFAARMVVDRFWLDDMQALVSTEELVDQLRRGASRTIENVLINGDTAGTHQDTIASWTVGGIYTAGALGGSNSPLTQILGFRAKAADDSTTNDCGQTFSSTVAFAAKERQGVHGGAPNSGWLTNLHVLHTQLLPNSNFLTVDKIGNDMATIRSGTMGTLLGDPVDISQFVTNDLDATSGVYDGSGDTTSCLIRNNYGAYNLWMLQEFTTFEVMEEQAGAVHLGATMRMTMATNCASGEKPTSLDFDL